VEIVLPCLVLAMLLDYLFGEPSRYHPLVGLGRWARWVEARCMPSSERLPPLQILSGCLAFALVLVPVLMLCIFVFSFVPHVLEWLFVAMVLYFCIAARSLEEHARAVASAIENHDLEAARAACAMMVSRDTQQLNEEQLAAATVESVLENANDAVIAPLVWFVLASVPGVLVFRVANTLDAMWGYRNARYRYFGRFAARVDDVLGYIPARISVALYALQDKRALFSASSDGAQWSSPNAGPVMAAGAAGLGVRLGGPAVYDGVSSERPWLSDGRRPVASDIGRSILFVRKTYLAFVAGVSVMLFFLGVLV
jgi:adenosylcobinamide-phosphate synthase